MSPTGGFASRGKTSAGSAVPDRVEPGHGCLARYVKPSPRPKARAFGRGFGWLAQTTLPNPIGVTNAIPRAVPSGIVATAGQRIVGSETVTKLHVVSLGSANAGAKDAACTHFLVPASRTIATNASAPSSAL